MATITPPSRVARVLARTASAFLIIPLLVACMPALPAEAAVSSWQQKGISFYPFSSTDFSSSGFRANVDHYKSLGMNTITLIIPIYQSNTGSTDIGPGNNTPTDASLISAVQYAHTQGMKVMFKMHLDTYDGQWRANINPSDRATWYANYLGQLKHYGQIAEAQQVEAYCIGTELIDMASSVKNPDNTQQWQNMITQLRQMYHGQVTYDANWGSDTNVGEAQYIKFWPSTDFVGISAYYPLSGDGSVQQNTWSWAGWENSEIAKIQSDAGKPVVFTEVGYRSMNNAHQAPFNSWDNTGYNAQEQVNDYQALLQFWDGRAYMQGVDLWYANSDPNAGGAGNTDYFVSNKPVEQTLKNWFLAGSATSTPQGPGPAFAITGDSTPTSAATGQPVSSTANVKDTGGAAFGTNVDLEVYDGTGHQVAQKIFASQDFTGGDTKAFNLPWTPASEGTYTFKAGIFDSNWNLYAWNDAAATITVGTSGSTGTTTPPGGTGTTTPPSPSDGAATFTAGGSASPSQPSAGAAVALSAQVNDTGGAVSGTNIDLEVFDPSGHQAFQRIYTGEDFGAGQSKMYSGSWTPTESGTYTFKVGVFDSNWNLYAWNDTAAQISVGGTTTNPGGTGTTTPPGGTGTTTPSSGIMDIWWPTDGSSVSGVQPFKALIEGMDLSSYDMYWQVDGDQPNAMNDSQTDAPHKEALVDVGGWNWKGNGPYQLTFVAKDKSGAVIASKNISIYVMH